MSGTADLYRLQADNRRLGRSVRIESRLPIGVRPRQLSVRTLLIGMLITLTDHRPAHLCEVHQALIRLPEDRQVAPGRDLPWKSGPHELTYRQTERTFGLVNKTLSKEHPDGQPSQILSEVMDRLLQGSVTVLGTPESSSLAIDWSDYESFARPPRKDGRRRQAPTASLPRTPRAHPAPPTARTPSGRQRNPSKARMSSQAAPTRRQHGDTATQTTPARSETFFGYYLQAATIVKEEHGPETPELVRRVTLSSCKHDPPRQIVPVLGRMRDDGHRRSATYSPTAATHTASPRPSQRQPALSAQASSSTCTPTTAG